LPWGAAPSEDLQSIFLRLIDTLTPSHLRLLRFLQQPLAYLQGPLPEERILADDVLKAINWEPPSERKRRADGLA
jgi:hypothetical protein